MMLVHRPSVTMPSSLQMWAERNVQMTQFVCACAGLRVYNFFARVTSLAINDHILAGQRKTKTKHDKKGTIHIRPLFCACV